MYADDILTHVKNTRLIGKYTVYVGKIKEKMSFLTGRIMPTVTKYGMVLLICFIKQQLIVEQNSIETFLWMTK